jgi:ABC-2 type transport system permease protein
MSVRPVLGIVLRQLYLLRSSPVRVLPLFAWALIDIVLWGFMARYLNTLDTKTADFVPQLLGAVLFWDFFARVMQGVTMPFFEDLWSRNFVNLFAAPLSIAQYVSGLVIASILTSAVGLVVMLLLATSAFGLDLFRLGSWLVPAVLVLFLFGTALGIVACALVLRFGPASEWLVWPIPGFLSPFAAVFYPLSTLPEWMRAVARVIPPAYIFEDLRAIIAGGRPEPGAQLVAAGIAIVQVLLAARLFVLVYRHAVRHGLLARYSAESVS